MAGEACEAGTLPSSLCWSMAGSGPGHLVCVQRCDRPGVHLGSGALLLKSFFSPLSLNIFISYQGAPPAFSVCMDLFRFLCSLSPWRPQGSGEEAGTSLLLGLTRPDIQSQRDSLCHPFLNHQWETIVLLPCCTEIEELAEFPRFPRFALRSKGQVALIQSFLLNLKVSISCLWSEGHPWLGGCSFHLSPPSLSLAAANEDQGKK